MAEGTDRFVICTELNHLASNLNRVSLDSRGVAEANARRIPPSNTHEVR